MTTPLISTRTMIGLGEALETSIGPIALSQAVEASGLPKFAFHTHNGYIPHLGQLTFLEALALPSEGKLTQNLGSQLRISDYGAFGNYIVGGRTFGAALARTVAGTRWHMSHDRTTLTQRLDVVRFGYESKVRNARGYSHYAPLAACVLLSIAKPYLGPAVRPKLVRIDSARQGSHSEWEQFFGCQVRFDCQSMSLDFDIEMLERTRLGPPPPFSTIEDVARESSRRAPRDFVGVTQQLIRLAVLDGEVSLDSIAKQLRLGPRTFRRRLEAEGLTFRALVASLRSESAIELLSDGAFSVKDVALSIGYSDAAHFVRAFKRETGRTPGEIMGLR